MLNDCISILAAAALMSSLGMASAWAERTNVLYIVADDLRPELGCLGGEARAPALDGLARRGVRFASAYCQQALCNPSRSSFLTGRRPDELRVWSNSVHFRENIPDIKTLPQWFKEQGYESRCVGKIFHNFHTKWKGDRRSWSADEFLYWGHHGHDHPQVTGEVPPNLALAAPRKYGEVPLWEKRDVPDEAYFDGRIAAEAERVLRELKDRPFFVAVGFWKPHAPFNPPKKYWDLYDRERISRPDRTRPRSAPEIAFHDGRELRGEGPNAYTFDDHETVEMRHGYLAGISFLDAQVGRLLGVLDELGLAEKTVVVFHGDHGFHLGEHDLWAKTSNFELDAHVPMIVAPPACAEGGKVATGPVELIDVFPTVCELAGVEKPGGLSGVSLAPVFVDASKRVKEGAFTQHPRPAYFDRGENPRFEAMGYSVRTSRARYTEWREAATGSLIAAELYDYEGDPGERVNQIEGPADRAVLLEARAMLHAQFPPGKVPAQP